MDENKLVQDAMEKAKKLVSQQNNAEKQEKDVADKKQNEVRKESKDDETVEEFKYALDFELTNDELLNYFLDDVLEKEFVINNKFRFVLRVPNSIENLLFQLMLSYLLRKKDAYIVPATFNMLRVCIAARFSVLSLGKTVVYKPLKEEYEKELLELIYSSGYDMNNMNNITTREVQSPLIVEFLDKVFKEDLSEYIVFYSKKPPLLMNIISDTNAKLISKLNNFSGDTIKNF